MAHDRNVQLMHFFRCAN